MSLTASVISFSIILPAELPDKTVLACLVMGSRYRPVFVFADVVGGRSLLKIILLVWVTRGTALVMLAFAGASIATALV